MLYHVILYYNYSFIILNYFILYHINLYNIISYHFISYYITLYYIILHYIILYYTILYYIHTPSPGGYILVHNMVMSSWHPVFFTSQQLRQCEPSSNPATQTSPKIINQAGFLVMSPFLHDLHTHGAETKGRTP